jgi:MFS family permease
MGIVWAKVSDRIGRKPTLMVGVVEASISALTFGCSTSLWMALTARAFGGLVNPNVGVISACVEELVKRKEHQGKSSDLELTSSDTTSYFAGKAFSVVRFLRGVGRVFLSDSLDHLSRLIHQQEPHWPRDWWSSSRSGEELAFHLPQREFMGSLPIFTS